MPIVTARGKSNDQSVGRIPVKPESDVCPRTGKEMLPAHEGNERAPLSFAQHRLWFLDQINPGDVSSNISRAVRILGALDQGALERTISATIERHDALRTTFARTELSAGTDGAPRQLISATLEVALPFIDLSTMAPVERETKAREVAGAEAQRSFDLTMGPLVRPALVKLREDEHVFLLTAHRIVMDDASMDVFFREVWEGYKSGEKLLRPRIQFADYAAWQRSALDDDILKQHVDYWKSKVADLPAVIDLPTDRPRPPVRSSRGGSVSIVLGSRLTAKLTALSQSEDATFFMIFLTAFQILLARCSGCLDIVVGSNFPNRDFEGTQDLIGPFSDLLPYRLNLSGRPRFRQLLAQAKRTTLEAHEHHLIPFGRLVDELHVERNLSHAPLFQVALNLKYTPLETSSVAGLELAEFEFDRGATQFDLTLDLSQRGEEIETRLEYNAELFDPETASRLLGRFEVLLEGIVHAPNGEVLKLPLLTESERRQLLLEWPSTDAAYPDQQCFHKLFAIQAARTPDRTAVVYLDV